MNIELDLRHYWQYVRDQGARSSCFACAASDSHMRVQSLHHSLSAEYLFYNTAGYMPGGDVSNGVTFHAMQQALERHGQPDECEWPYQPVQPNPWVPPPVGNVWKAQLLVNEGSDPAALNKASATTLPFILVVKLTAEFINVAGPNYVIPASGLGFGGHALLVVGLGYDSAGKIHFLIRNSWGAGWGQNGHAWLPVGYLEDKLLGSCDIRQSPKTGKDDDSYFMHNEG